jgi:hypothetical protein
MSITKAREKKLLTQKDLMSRWSYSTPRAVQRARKRFGLKPVDFYGNNPLFLLSDVEKVEEARRKAGLERMEKCAKRAATARSGILTLKQVRRAARTRRAAK